MLKSSNKDFIAIPGMRFKKASSFGRSKRS